MELFSQRLDLKQRDPKFKAADKAALQAIAQAAVNVELFTIPLYMVSLYSIHGMHQITSKGNDFYKGRLWPGRAPSRAPNEDSDPYNARAFNLLFSVFIDEMLHLQLASNIAKALGVTPSFTSPVLMNSDYGWTCYANYETVIPHILDFADTEEPEIRVMLGALSEKQNRLFLAIEENDNDALSIISYDKRKKYFPKVPFANWQATSTEAQLPMFGTIGHMYKCLWEYMEIEYTDQTNLFDSVFDAGALERDLFNSTEGNRLPEYPNMPTMVSPDAGNPRARILGMINAITDQGEGQGVAQWISERLGLLQYAPVHDQFRPNKEALETDYPNYTDTGAPNDPSGNSVARVESGALDHYDRFIEIGQWLQSGKVVTWDQWHTQGHKWTAGLLTTTGYDPDRHDIPPPEAVADALNALHLDDINARDSDRISNYAIFSQIAAGAIAGITRVLGDFWTKEGTAFPSPSMYGSGDRVSICWAIFGGAPDLSAGIAAKDPKTPLYNACQGLNLAHASGAHPQCAPIAVAHSCRGSNTCKAEGGCGFVQLAIGPQPGCGFKALREHSQPMPAGASPAAETKQYSAPSDNHCAGFGGCAVPISASQMFPPPADGPMVLFDFEGKDFTLKPLDPMPFKAGELVYDVAWKAYIEVLNSRRPIPALPSKPKNSNMRLALPPST
jgi:hypothetical protein